MSGTFFKNHTYSVQSIKRDDLSKESVRECMKASLTMVEVHLAHQSTEVLAYKAGMIPVSELSKNARRKLLADVATRKTQARNLAKLKQEFH